MKQALDASDVLVQVAGDLCEGPRWDARSGRLVWVDIMAGLVHTVDPLSGGRAAHDLGMPVSAVAPRRDGGWVAAVERGFLLLGASWTPESAVVAAPGQAAGTRFNDGACDPAGRFWAGTLSYDGAAGRGALYRLEADGRVVEVLTGVTNSNGIGWSPDGSILYYVDTGQGTVDRLDYDESSGEVGNRRTLVRVAEQDGLPDGLTVDSTGCLWLALWGGWAVRRYSPAGELLATIRLPVQNVTSVSFGGAGLDELFITTARAELTDDQLRDQPLAGSVFHCRPGATGLTPAAFAG